jgi:ketosteroid isomerase-like protein
MLAQRRRTGPAIASLLLLMALAGPVAAQETQDTTQLPESLRTARASMSAALTKLDGNAAAALFTDDGAVDFGGQVITGKPAVAGWFGEAFNGVAALRFGTPVFVIADGRVTERSSYTVVVPDGEQGGSAETVWVRQEDGSWRVTRLIVS